MMRRILWRIVLVLMLLILGLLPVGMSRASTAFLLRKHTFANASGLMQSGSYVLNASLGQLSPVGSMSSSNLRLQAGYWQRGAAVPEDEYLYLPLVIR